LRFFDRLSSRASRLAIGRVLVAAGPHGAASGAGQLLPQQGAYDPSIPLFLAAWTIKTGHMVAISGSCGGSGFQAKAVIRGRLVADRAGLVQAGWQKDLPSNAVASSSTIAFFTHGGHPNKVNSWRELENNGVLKNVPEQPKDARKATNTFITLGKGDGLLNWEPDCQLPPRAPSSNRAYGR
jgi:sulfate transport system substrate-binding protein